MLREVKIRHKRSRTPVTAPSSRRHNMVSKFRKLCLLFIGLDSSVQQKTYKCSIDNKYVASGMGRLFVSSPRKPVFLVVVIVVALLASVYAYLASLPPQRGPRVSITSPPLEFSMELEKAEFQQGENVTIRLSLKNIGNETITLRWGKYYAYYDKVMYFDFYITDANNTLVYQWTRIHARANLCKVQ